MDGEPERDFGGDVSSLVGGGLAGHGGAVLKIIVGENNPKCCPVAVLRGIERPRLLEQLRPFFVVLLLEGRPAEPEMGLRGGGTFWKFVQKLFEGPGHRVVFLLLTKNQGFLQEPELAFLAARIAGNQQVVILDGGIEGLAFLFGQRALRKRRSRQRVGRVFFQKPGIGGNRLGEFFRRRQAPGRLVESVGILIVGKVFFEKTRIDLAGAGVVTLLEKRFGLEARCLGAVLWIGCFFEEGIDLGDEVFVLQGVKAREPLERRFAGGRRVGELLEQGVVNLPRLEVVSDLALGSGKKLQRLGLGIRRHLVRHPGSQPRNAGIVAGLIAEPHRSDQRGRRPFDGPGNFCRLVEEGQRLVVLMQFRRQRGGLHAGLRDDRGIFGVPGE